MPNFPCGHWQYRKPRRTKYEHSAALAVLPPEAGGKAPHLGYDARHTQASGSSTGTQKNTHGSSGPATQARNMTTTKLKAAAFTAAGASATERLNSSYDVARELFAALNPGYIAQWDKAHPDGKLTIRQLHAGSSKQAPAILQGLKADVVTCN